MACLSQRCVGVPALNVHQRNSDGGGKHGPSSGPMAPPTGRRCTDPVTGAQAGAELADELPMSAHPHDLTWTQSVRPIPADVAAAASRESVDLLFSSPEFEYDDVVGARVGVVARIRTATDLHVLARALRT